jgi:N6-adenosine-specific RNA methylase IME4
MALETEKAVVATGGLQSDHDEQLCERLDPLLTDANDSAQAPCATKDVEDQLEGLAREIEHAQSSAIQKMGACLAQARELFRYRRDEGGFTGWIDRRLSISERTAYNLISVYERFGGESLQLLQTLPRRALYCLATASDDVVEAVEARVEAGATVTVNEIQTLKQRAESIVDLPKESQRQILAQIAANPAGRSALKQVAKEVRAGEQKERHTERQQKLEDIAARNPELPAGRLFSLVLIDVPRHHNVYSDMTGAEKAPENHYATMSFDELLAFPIDRFAAPDAIILYWSTAASLLDDIDILSEWGFVSVRRRDDTGRLLRDEDGQVLPPAGRGRYGSHQIWRKVRTGKQTGTGRWFWDQHEILIAARRGNIDAPLPGTQDESIFDSPVGDHSSKPHAHIREWVDRVWPDLSKVEVFARGTAPSNWTFWGNQSAPASTPEVRDGAEGEQEPTGKRSKACKVLYHAGDLESALAVAFVQITSVAGECREIVDSAPEGLSESERIQVLGATAETLAQVEQPQVIAALADVDVIYTTTLPKRKDRSVPRATRMLDAMGILVACMDALDKITDRDTRHVAARDLHADLDRIKLEAEGCEFPGMYG